MALFSLRQPLGVLRLNLVLVLVLALPAATGALGPLEASLRRLMLVRPLPPFWFPLFIGVGALLPLLLRLLGRRRSPVRRVLTPYLLLLAGQIATEVAVVLVAGKGLGVLVGLVFTLVRLGQLVALWPLAAPLGWLRGLVVLELGLWGLNAGQIVLNRWLPLLA
ncbi:MAG: hypothetical protein VKN13_09750 [Cyanobacteriota bacterium]|nr:hypothetical protein [Cyanobacteriota bacterium]